MFFVEEKIVIKLYFLLFCEDHAYLNLKLHLRLVQVQISLLSLMITVKQDTKQLFYVIAIQVK